MAEDVEVKPSPSDPVSSYVFNDKALQLDPNKLFVRQLIPESVLIEWRGEKRSNVFPCE